MNNDTIQIKWALVAKENITDANCDHIWGEQSMLTETIDAIPPVKAGGVIQGIVNWVYMWDDNYLVKTCDICGETHYSRQYHTKPQDPSKKVFEDGKKSVSRVSKEEIENDPTVLDIVDPVSLVSSTLTPREYINKKLIEYKDAFDAQYIQDWKWNIVKAKFERV